MLCIPLYYSATSPKRTLFCSKKVTREQRRPNARARIHGVDVYSSLIDGALSVALQNAGAMRSSMYIWMRGGEVDVLDHARRRRKACRVVLID